MTRPTSVVADLALALGTGLAAWLSLGTVGFGSAAGDRLGFLPLSPATVLVAGGIAFIAGAVLWSGAARTPFSLLVLTGLPWLPSRVPSAFLIWSGPILIAVWLTVALLIVRSLTKVRPRVFSEAGWSSATGAPLRAGLVACLVFAAAAWRVAPSRPGGDEPHYLIITQSLLLDGDLQIENNHRRGDYQAYYGGELAPHYVRTGRGGAIYSIHAPGLPAIVLPAFALGGYRGVVAFLVLLAAAGSALAWWVSWLATRNVPAAWFGWAAVTLSITAVFHSFSVYPDGLAGVLTLTGVWALLRAEKGDSPPFPFDSGKRGTVPFFWHGVALAVMPWLHSRLAVLATTAGAVILLRLSRLPHAAAKAVAFLSIPAASALLWLGYFIAVYGAPDPSAPYGAGEIGSIVWIPGGLAGLFFDQRFGLFPYAPVLVFAIAGFIPMLLGPATRRLALELLFVMVPYLLTVGQFPMWWGGNSAPARFFIPLLPALCVPAAVFWTKVQARRSRLVPLAALGFTVLATAIVVTVDRGRLAFNTRDAPALWLEWLSTTANLARGAPAWARDGVPLFARDILVWTAAMVLAVLAALRTFRRFSHSAHPVLLTWALAAAVMVAATIVWTLHGVDGRAVVPAQLQLVRVLASPHGGVIVDLERPRTVALASLLPRFRIDVTRPMLQGRTGRDGTLFQLPRIPAGQYRLVPPPTARGWLMVGIGRDQFSLHTTPLPIEAIDLDFPIGVRAIVIRGDEDARRTVSSMTIEPRTILPSDSWPTEIARTAVKYQSAAVFFLDDRSFPEPEGFWIGGARSTAFVVRPDQRARSVSLVFRNGPVPNHAVLESRGDRTDLEFGPGDERRIAVPVDPARGACAIGVRVIGGFRPSAEDASSRDTRFLGLYVRIE